MPKKNNNKKNNKNKNNSVQPYVRTDLAVFRTFNVVSASTSATTITVTRFDLAPPNMGTRAVMYADLFQLYRVVGLTIHLDCTSGLLGSLNPLGVGNVLYMVAIVYKPVSTFTAPGTVAEFVDLPHSAWNHDFSYNRVTIRVGKKDLLSASPAKWYQTSSNGASDILEQVQLSVALLTRTRQSSIVAAELSYQMQIHVEFKGPIDPADIPLRRTIVDDEKNVFPSGPISTITTCISNTGGTRLIRSKKEQKEIF
jgi:hypothetical protein